MLSSAVQYVFCFFFWVFISAFEQSLALLASFSLNDECKRPVVQTFDECPGLKACETLQRRVLYLQYLITRLQPLLLSVTSCQRKDSMYCLTYVTDLQAHMKSENLTESARDLCGIETLSLACWFIKYFVILISATSKTAVFTRPFNTFYHDSAH